MLSRRKPWVASMNWQVWILRRQVWDKKKLLNNKLIARQTKASAIVVKVSLLLRNNVKTVGIFLCQKPLVVALYTFRQAWFAFIFACLVTSEYRLDNPLTFLFSSVHLRRDFFVESRPCHRLSVIWTAFAGKCPWVGTSGILTEARRVEAGESKK